MRIAKVIKAQCAETKNYFGIRTEEKLPDFWEATWGFPMKETMQVTETYHDKVRGQFKILPTYPGCPHCHQKGLFLCQCNKISCIDFTKRTHRCPWCNSVADNIVTRNEEINIGAGST
jgi:hypothetical protein